MCEFFRYKNRHFFFEFLMTLRSETLDYKSVNMEHFIYKETFFSEY